MRVGLLITVLPALFGCGHSPSEEAPQVKAAFFDSPWNISLAGFVALEHGERLQSGPHRVEVWVESPGCGVHSVLVLIRADGEWILNLAAESAECVYGGTLTIKSAWINGRKMEPVQDRYEWRVLGDPMKWVFCDAR